MTSAAAFTGITAALTYYSSTKVPAGERLFMLCPETMRPHCDDVLAGEYDVPYLAKAPVILDIGANVGSFALWALKKWPDAKLICYEPAIRNFEYLTANLEGKAALHNLAVGSPSRTKLYQGRHNCGECSFFLGTEQTPQYETVTTISALDLPPADILKIDTEGCEYEILTKVWQRDYDIILCEYHSETDRRNIDYLLLDYVLCGAKIFRPDRGILKYYNKKLTLTTGETE